MVLLTKDVLAQLLANGRRQDPVRGTDQEIDFVPVVKLFIPCGIGTLDRRQVGSLAGLVPYNRDSGQWKGKSFISGGRKPLRDALYMPALVAMRFNPDPKAKYYALRAPGKPAKVAIVAVMRKLIETANALVKADLNWVKKRLDRRRPDPRHP